MVDRVKGPEIVSIGNQIKLPKLMNQQLSNSLNLYAYSDPTVAVIQLSVVFKAGLWHHSQKLVSSLTNRLMREGTINYSSKLLAETFDFYGASVQNHHDSDLASYTITC
jgi:predicted Zn-dependent peptidase